MQQGPVGAGRKVLMTWLIGAADISKQVATTRAKAIKALGLVAEQDPRLLVLEVVRDGVYRALQVCNTAIPASSGWGPEHPKTCTGIHSSSASDCVLCASMHRL